MNAVQPTAIHIEPQELIERRYERREALFGAIKYWKTGFTNKLGERLFIALEVLPAEIVINGVKYVPKS